MAKTFPSLLDRLRQRRMLRRWSRMGDTVGEMPADALRSLRTHARQLRRLLDRVIHDADDRLTLPAIGSNALRRPAGADWVWRPDPWRGAVAVPGQSPVPGKAPVSDGVTLFHDCRRSELTLRQIRNTREADLAPFGLRLDVFSFDGSFLSLVIDLPEPAVTGLRRRHLIRLEAMVEMEKPLEIYGRLNIKHGPNVEQILRELPLREEAVIIEFDLNPLKLDESRIEKLWLDLILEGPQMNQVTFRDVTLSRRPRADI
jgi:Family of unknown function (DUF6478)